MTVQVFIYMTSGAGDDDGPVQEAKSVRTRPISTSVRLKGSSYKGSRDRVGIGPAGHEHLALCLWPF